MNNLQELILKHKGVRTYATLADASGGRISASMLHRLATTEAKSFPGATTLEGLAQALQQPINAVVLAAARSAGLDTQPTPNVHHLNEQLFYHQHRAATYKTQLTDLRARMTTPNTQEP